MGPMRLVLASGSPRRRELLALAGLLFETTRVDLDETPYPGETPAAYVERLAWEKARAALSDLSASPSLSEQPPGLARAARGALSELSTVVLAADTTVALDGEIFGKPLDAADARAMLRRLSGREHEVLTGLCVLGPERDVRRVVVSRVRFTRLSDEAIAWYVADGEPLDKAGAYGYQGKGALWVDGIVGSASNIVGLPLAETMAALVEAGVAPPWRGP